VTPRYFATPAAFRAWLEKHHATSDELLVGFYKKGSGKPSIIWQESVDAALCYGWIDGIRHPIDEDSYQIRFTPRKPGSSWSAVNIKRAKELVALGLMRPAGLRAFELRDEAAAQRAHDARRTAALDADMEREFQQNQRAWAFFVRQPPSYRRLAAFWVVNAKRAETRARRLATLIDDSAHERPIKAWPRPANRG
jgi:uncharacterized protein YdeI (YjbR/CyaY-like superfamily)